MNASKIIIEDLYRLTRRIVDNTDAHQYIKIFNDHPARYLGRTFRSWCGSCSPDLIYILGPIAITGDNYISVFSGTSGFDIQCCKAIQYFEKDSTFIASLYDRDSITDAQRWLTSLLIRQVVSHAPEKAINQALEEHRLLESQSSQ